MQVASSEMSVCWTDERAALRIYDEVRCELCCSVHTAMHNTTVLALALRMIDGIHHTFTIRCVHGCIYLVCVCFVKDMEHVRAELGVR